ncbi:16.9 kDa class I heat shock protein 1-like isoform X2 [Salvia hispanica]|nr:16.9 kDa class I heat shock protein 1-like isoform X2 [Salvia hispanica]
MKMQNASLRIGGNFVYESGKTTLCVTKVAQSNRVVSSQIYWDRVSIPERWLVEESPFSEWQRARVDWREAAEAHVLKVDVPGFNEEEVKVEVEDGGGILQISGERREEGGGEEGDKWHCAERGGGKFLRRLRLPENARLDELKAGLEKGVLTVTVPKEEVSGKVQVKVEDISG